MAWVLLSALYGVPAAYALPAFPGAEGYGSETPGGRGGRVIEVTNLADAGPGSLRQALEVETGPRIVVFRVGGTIELSRTITIGEANSYVTIAGQTAPGDGIQIKNWPIAVRGGAHDVVMRYLRLRPGTDAVTEENGGDIDGILIWGSEGKHTYNVVVDHCSVMWAVDENADATGANTDITFQWCIFAEGTSVGHISGPHSMGMLIGRGGGFPEPYTVTVHHCLFAHNGGRNPLVGFGDPTCSPCARVDFRHNVIYNWSNNNYAQFQMIGQFTEADAIQANFVGNQYIKGPDSNVGDDSVIWIQGLARLYLSRNWTPRTPRGAGGGRDVGVRDITDPEQHHLPPSAYRVLTPFPTPPVSSTPMFALRDLVLDNAGATLPRRDEVDARVVADVRAGTGHVGKNSDHPVLKSADPPPDSDHDGMPDAWETAHGLDPDDAEDRNGDLGNDGYTNVEQYLNQLAAGDR